MTYRGRSVKAQRQGAQRPGATEVADRATIPDRQQHGRAASVASLRVAACAALRRLVAAFRRDLRRPRREVGPSFARRNMIASI